MRMLLFFDLPTITSKDRKNYTQFRRFLIKEGFIMLQESVYCKLVLNRSVLNSIKRRINKNAPSKGIIQLLCVTEKQYASMEYISGQKKHKNLDTTERLIII